MPQRLRASSPDRPPPNQARNETRTRDPLLTMEVLYQLSYPGASGSTSQLARGSPAIVPRQPHIAHNPPPPGRVATASTPVRSAPGL